jgi:hypothetical protein
MHILMSALSHNRTWEPGSLGCPEKSDFRRVLHPHRTGAGNLQAVCREFVARDIRFTPRELMCRHGMSVGNFQCHGAHDVDGFLVGILKASIKKCIGSSRQNVQVEFGIA